MCSTLLFDLTWEPPLQVERSGSQVRVAHRPESSAAGGFQTGLPWRVSPWVRRLSPAGAGTIFSAVTRRRGDKNPCREARVFFSRPAAAGGSGPIYTLLAMTANSLDFRS